MKLIARQKIWLVVIVVANLLLWIIPSDVVENIARDRHTLLGRYSRTHFVAILGLLLFSGVSFYVDWSTGVKYKRRWFTVLATLLMLAPSLALVDFVLRGPQSEHYVRDGVAFHRPAHFTHTERVIDKPQAARSYPDAPPGYPPIDCTMTIDARGYRNAEALERADVVVLGDSFAEGSSVSDDQSWPVRLAKRTGMTVYNLGMSSYDPMHYLASLEKIGLSLKPRYVLCGVYEGNDFRSSKSDRKRRNPSVSKRMGNYFKHSPIRAAFDSFLVNTFGPINATGSVSGGDILDWLPLSIPQGQGAKRYAFAPKQLRDLYESQEAFESDKHWLNPRHQLEEMNRMCKEAGITFVVVYTPLKAHVTLPLVADALPAAHVQAFLAMRYKRELPPPDEFMRTLLKNAPARLEVVTHWCQREGIPIVNLVPPLRAAAMAGRQVYFTYDQHFTPDGHDVTAEAIASFLAAEVSRDDG